MQKRECEHLCQLLSSYYGEDFGPATHPAHGWVIGLWTNRTSLVTTFRTPLEYAEWAGVGPTRDTLHPEGL